MSFANKTACLAPKLQVSSCPRPLLWISAFKEATLAPKLQVSKGPSPHRGLVHSKQRHYDQNQ